MSTTTATKPRVTFVVIAGIDTEPGEGQSWEGRTAVAEISRPTLIAARDTMRALIGKTAADALSAEGAEPDMAGWEPERYGAYPLRGFSIARYHEDDGTLDELHFDAEGRA